MIALRHFVIKGVYGKAYFKFIFKVYRLKSCVYPAVVGLYSWI